MPVFHPGETDVARMQRGGFREQAHDIGRVQACFLDKETEMLALTRQFEWQRFLDEKIPGHCANGALSCCSAKGTRMLVRAVVAGLFAKVAAVSACHLIACSSRSMASAMPVFSFNVTSEDEGKRAVFGDLRFRQAMSVAIKTGSRSDLNCSSTRWRAAWLLFP